MRNIESRLSSLPSVNIKRSMFNMPPTHHLTTMNAGKLVPVFCLEVLPGSTYSLRTDSLVRMSTPIHPVMDDCYIDTYFFFVPNRLVWDNWEEFMGENKTDSWTKDMPTYTIPTLDFDVYGAEKGSQADYFGIPTNVKGLKVNALPFRAYQLIWNDWFRDQNTMAPLNLLKDSQDVTYAGFGSGATFDYSATHGTELLPVSKFHDYFTSALQEPQRGPDVLLPIGDSAPVITGDTLDSSYLAGNNPLKFAIASNGGSFGGTRNLTAVNTTLYVNDSTTASQSPAPSAIVPSNLYADLSEATLATINEVRLAFALQTFYEASARYGGRYTELLRGHFGVISPDSRLQRPEYIGGKRRHINMQQVLQTSATNDVSPQGNTAAFSLTVDFDKSFRYSAVEHGFIIGVCCIRTKQTYQYGLERFWSRNDMTDYYFPEFANIGEQPVLNKEIYAQGTDQDDQVFGYQEAWAEYRQFNSRVSGAYRSNYAQSLDSWHYAEKYDSLPTLSAEFMQQSTDVIDRTLAVSSEIEDQFLCDFCFNLTAVLPMPMYSIPGLGMRF